MLRFCTSSYVESLTFQQHSSCFWSLGSFKTSETAQLKLMSISCQLGKVHGAAGLLLVLLQGSSSECSSWQWYLGLKAVTFLQQRVTWARPSDPMLLAEL